MAETKKTQNRLFRRFESSASSLREQDSKRSVNPYLAFIGRIWNVSDYMSRMKGTVRRGKGTVKGTPLIPSPLITGSPRARQFLRAHWYDGNRLSLFDQTELFDLHEITRLHSIEIDTRC